MPNYPERFDLPPTDPVLTVRFNPETKERSLPHWLGEESASADELLTLAQALLGRAHARLSGQRQGQQCEERRAVRARANDASRARVPD
jgi:hypothetical protein